MDNSKEALLSMKKVSLTYPGKDGGVEALKDIDLDIYEHEFVCVLGPSGCGKSTLLNILAGFIGITGGSILLSGKEIKGIDPSRGVVFQKDNLYPWFSVRSNVDYGLRMKKIPKEERVKKTDEILTRMGLMEFADRKVYELSGGMRQRASIGRTLINDPSILLMDEPFSALDAFTREQMQDFLRDLWINSRNTIFFITHDIDEAMVLGTRLIVLSSRPGQVIRDQKLEYTRMISEEGNSRHKLPQSYFELRKEVFEQIVSVQAPLC